jgi:hypothetical protein
VELDRRTLRRVRGAVTARYRSEGPGRAFQHGRDRARRPDLERPAARREDRGRARRARGGVRCTSTTSSSSSLDESLGPQSSRTFSSSR